MVTPATSGAAALIQPLIDPANLATLGERKANQRIQKVTAILYDAKASGQDPAKIASESIGLIGWGGSDRIGLYAGEMLSVGISNSGKETAMGAAVFLVRWMIVK